MTRQSASPVTVLGLGPMGTALATTFVENGHPTTVWNRTPGKADQLLAKGATGAATAGEAIAASPLVIVSVIDYDAVHAVLAPIATELKGKTVVNVTADAPDRAREAAAWAAEHGIDYVDGSIMTPAATIGRPEAVFLYSGARGLYERHRQTLSTLGSTATHVGDDPGRAAAYDVALLDIFWTAMSGVVHAFTLARAENVGAGELVPFAQGIIDVVSQVTAEIAGDADAGRFPGDDSTLASNAASMDHIIHAARARGVDASVMEAAKAVAGRAIDAGHGDEGFARLVELLGRGHTSHAHANV